MKIIFLALSISLFYSCGKPLGPADPITENTPGAKVIDKTITNSMYFKLGSYWIYEGDRGEYDSVWVDSRSTLNFDMTSKTQQFNTYLFSSIEQNSRVIWCQFRQIEPDTQYRIQIAKYYRGTSSGLINADIFRRSKGSTNNCITCTGDTAILMPTYTLNGIRYTNVWRFLTKDIIKDYPSSLITDTVGYYFFAENYGIIQKFENVSGAPNHFKLIRYHIEK